ncbi:MAG: ADP-forming succinate--CoA ligase subunit beta [Candidatus Methanoperedens sp.]|nr:ADP-forming succinate--CoA ligase subunit beta [Candidatus Methanoperedens sp.]
MKLYEYASKEIFSKYNIPIPASTLVSDADGAKEAARKMGDVVIKAQVLTGGRGKAGGIARASSPQKANIQAKRILGISIKEYPVKKVLIEEYREPIKEMYLGITIDRKRKCPVIMASSQGGIDIEEIAKSSPERITMMHIHPLTGIHEYQARMLANSLDRNKSPELINIIKKLYRVFIDKDCQLVEINPLAETQDGVIALDAKMVIDDNALFRQDFTEEETGSLEEMARKNGMSYVGLDGEIGCVVNGAGLAMATLDMIKQHGGEPANFMDVRAGANARQVKMALEIVSSNKNVKAIIINIFGGLTKCDEVAKGIIEIFPKIKIPLVVRLSGTNELEGRAMLGKYGIHMASSTEEAAKGVVELGHSN